jgi:hypothetical protein
MRIVGAGLNDAETPASADVGIAPGTRGSDVALEAADVEQCQAGSVGYQAKDSLRSAEEGSSRWGCRLWPTAAPLC